MKSGSPGSEPSPEDPCLSLRLSRKLLRKPATARPERGGKKEQEKKKRKILGQAVVDHKSIYTRLHNMSTSRL